jgi:tetratricopeptide (TPR) repeat protein
LAASILLEAKDRDSAFEVFEKLLEFEQIDHETKKSVAFDILSNAQHEVSRIARAETLFRELYDIDPTDSRVCFGLGISLMSECRSAKAEPYLQQAFESQPQPLPHCLWYFQCLILDDKHREIIEASDLALKHHPHHKGLLAYRDNSKLFVKSKQKPKAARWPKSAEELSDLKTAIRKFIFSGSVPPQFMFSKQDNIVTLGSCFAENVARSLRANGVDAYNITIGEAINSTYANLAYMKRVAGELDDQVTEMIRGLLGRDPASDRGRSAMSR